MPERDPLRSAGDFVIDVEPGDGGPWAYKSFRTQTPFTVTSNGDFVVRTGETERLRIKNDGTVSGVTSWPFIPKGTSRSDLGPSVLFDLETSLSGSNSSGAVRPFYELVSPDSIAQTAGKAEPFCFEHHYGGSNMQGGRNSLVSYSIFDGGASNASNPDRNYVGVQGVFEAKNGDGGTVGTPLGGGFGMSSMASLDAGVTNWLNVTAFEANTVTDPTSTASFVTGIQIADAIGAQGTIYDAALSISGLGGRTNIGHKTGILIGDLNGSAALASSSSVLSVVNHPTLDKGIDFPSTVFTTYAFAANGFFIKTPAGNHSIDIGRQDGVSSNSLINFHSGATLTAYDSRLLASGGDGTTGHGTLAVNAATFEIDGANTTATTLRVNAISGQTGWIQAWMVNGSPLLQVLFNGAMQTSSGNESTGAASAALGANSPATVPSAPYKWLRFATSDGTTVFIPAWK